MSLFSRVLYRISALCRCRIINGPDQQPYLERYHLLRLPFGYRVYLHRFVASDPGRGLHNHPWRRAFSVVLSGSYEEVRMLGADNDNTVIKRKVRSGNLNYIDGSIFHRINLIYNSECWTLFVHSPSSQSWGFMQHQNHRYAFHDHEEIVRQCSNPEWWKTAARPFQFPHMRKPLS